MAVLFTLAISFVYYNEPSFFLAQLANKSVHLVGNCHCSIGNCIASVLYFSCGYFLVANKHLRLVCETLSLGRRFESPR